VVSTALQRFDQPEHLIQLRERVRNLFGPSSSPRQIGDAADVLGSERHVDSRRFAQINPMRWNSRVRREWRLSTEHGRSTGSQVQKT
jgi:hypothetical protein